MKKKNKQPSIGDIYKNKFDMDLYLMVIGKVDSYMEEKYNVMWFGSSTAVHDLGGDRGEMDMRVLKNYYDRIGPTWPKDYKPD